MPFEARELLARIDVAEGVRLIVEGYLDDVQTRVPGVDLAPARLQEILEVRQNPAAREGEHRVRLGAGLRDREVRVVRLECGAQPGDEVGRQEGRVAGYGHRERGVRRLQACVQPGERTGEAADRVAHDAVAEGGVGLEVLVGVYDDGLDLRCEARDRPLGHRPTLERLQTLVDAAHASALAAGKDDSGDAIRVAHGDIVSARFETALSRAARACHTACAMRARNTLVAFLNLGHALDHLVMLVFPTVVIALARAWDRPYAELLPLTLGGFIAFGAFAIPAGWLADHWSRYKTMALFFFGIGASMLLTGFAQAPWQIAVGLTITGMFAAIYHPVGIAMLVATPTKMGKALGWNGLFGNLGLAAAAIISGALMDLAGWRAAFFVPGLAAIAAGIGFVMLVPDPGPVKKVSKSIGLHIDARTMTRIFAILLVATACGGIIFNATTISMPKVFDERLRELTQTNFGIGALVAGVYTLAAFAQVVVGTLIDRFEMKRLMIGVALFQIPLLALAANLEGWAMLFAALFMMLGVFGQIPLNDAIVGKYCADEYRARILGVRYVVSLGVASVAVPLVALLHGAGGGFRVVFFVLAALAAGMLVMSLLFPSRREIDAQRAAAAAAAATAATGA